MPDTAAGDRAALQERLQATFAKGARQDMGTVDPKDTIGFGLRPGKTSASVASAALGAAAGRFSSGGTIEGGQPLMGGLSRPAPKAAPEAPKVRFWCWSIPGAG